MQRDQTMDAAWITVPETLNLTRLPVPQLKDSDIPVRTAHVGICGTDVHLWQGHSFYYDHNFLTYPFVFGHEYTGLIVSTRGVDGMAEGDRVAGHCMVECPSCDNYRKGRRHLCRNLREVGLRHIPGVAARYVAVPAYAVTKLPDGLSFRAATLVEPTVTTYHAVERANVRSNDVMAMIGSGTLGLLALLVAKLTAARVDLIRVEDGGFEFGRLLSADRVLRPEQAQENAYSVVLEASGAPTGTGLAARILDLGGRCSLIGVINQTARDMISSLLALKDLTFHGILHSLDYYQQTVDLFACGLIDPTRLSVGPVSEAPDMFRKLIAPKRTKPKFVIEFAGEA